MTWVLVDSQKMWRQQHLVISKNQVEILWEKIWKGHLCLLVKLGKEEGKKCWHDSASGLEKFAKIKIALEGGLSKLALRAPRQKDPISRKAISSEDRGPTLSQHCPTNGTQLGLKTEEGGDNWHRWTWRNYFAEYKAVFSPHKIAVVSKRVLETEAD